MINVLDLQLKEVDKLSTEVNIVSSVTFISKIL